MPNWCT